MPALPQTLHLPRPSSSDPEALRRWADDYTAAMQREWAAMVYTLNALSLVDTEANRSATPDLDHIFHTASDTGQMYVAREGVWYEFGPGGGVLNVKGFGALGDGTTDDSVAFQAAHDALPSFGGTLLLPSSSGSYVLKDVAITKPGVRIEATSEQHNLMPVASGDTLFIVTGSDFSIGNVRLNTKGHGVGIHLRSPYADVSGCEFLSRNVDQGTFILLDNYTAAAVALSGAYYHRINNNRLGHAAFEPERAIATTGTFTIVSGGAAFTIGETVTGGTSGATGVLVGKAAGRLVLRRIIGTFANPETVTGGTSGATATTSATVTFADMNTLKITDNLGIGDNIIEIPNGGGNEHKGNTWQSRTGTSGTPAGNAVQFGGDWMGGGNYFERYANAYLAMNTNAYVSGIEHDDNNTNMYGLITSSPVPTLFGTKTGLHSMVDEVKALSVSANDTAIATSALHYSITGNGAHRTGTTFATTNARQGQIIKLYGDTWTVQFVEGSTGDFGELGTEFIIGQAANPVSALQATLFSVTLQYLDSKWRVIAYQGWAPGVATVKGWAIAGNDETVPFSARTVQISTSTNTTGHLLPTGVTASERHTIVYMGSGNTTAFAAGSNVLWGVDGAPTFGSGAGNAMSIDLEWSGISAMWWVRSRVNQA